MKRGSALWSTASPVGPGDTSMSRYSDRTSVRFSRFRPKLIRAMLSVCALALLSVAIPVQAHAQFLATQWAPLSPTEFETHRLVFAPYGIETHQDNLVILNWSTLRIFRIESSDYCLGALCLTIVTSACGKPSCPSTSLFAKREVEDTGVIAGVFGGTQFLRFPISKDRELTVIISKRFISVARGLGGD